MGGGLGTVDILIKGEYLKIVNAIKSMEWSEEKYNRPTFFM